MISRLGIVIHWLGFLVGLTLSAAALQYFLWMDNHTETRGFLGEIIFDYSLRDTPIYSPWVLLICLSGWPIRFILSGHKNPLPWSKESSK